MSVRVVNGKIELDKKPKHVDAPSPSQIAERAYDLAVRDVREYLDDLNATGAGLQIAIAGVGPQGESFGGRKGKALAALRESVINPGVLPWWRKPE